MRRYRSLIIMLVVSVISFGFFYFTAVRGLLFFKDSLRDDLARKLDSAKYNFEQEMKRSLKKIALLAGSDVVELSLRQFEFGESLQKGNLAFKQAAGGLQFLKRMRLVNMEEKIVIDTVDASLEGKKVLASENKVLAGINPKKGGVRLMRNGDLIVSVPCLSKPGRYMGSIIAYFDKKILLVKYEGYGTTRENYQVLFSDGVLFYNLPRHFASRKNIGEAAFSLRKSSRVYYSGNVIVIAEEVSSFPFLIAFGADRSQVGLPAIARIILLLNGLIFLGLLSLLILNVKTDRQRARLDQYRETIDSMSDEIKNSRATADQIMRQAEELNDVNESAGRKLSALPEQRQIVEDEAYSLDQVLEQNRRQEGNVSVLKFKERDEELQQLINQVSSHQTLEQPGAETTALSESPTSILGVHDLQGYWESIASLLHDTLKLSSYALLEPDEKGVFTVQRSLGFEEGTLASFSFSQTEKIYSNVLGRKKVLFLKDKVLGNKTIRHKLPGFAEDYFSQMAMIPVIRQEQLCALLAIFRRNGELEFDAYSLRELMYLSLL